MSEFVSLGDVVRFGVTIHHPSESGKLTNAEETPRFYAYRNNLDTVAMQGDFVLRTGLVGTYRASGIFNTEAGFSDGDYVEIHASGKVAGIEGRQIIKSFIIGQTLDANVVSVSGVPASPDQDIYFANIKFIKDSATPRDEYVVQWFKNALPLDSGVVTNPALSVHRTSDNSNLFENARLGYISINHGGLRYNESTNIQTSGEPYIAVASGTIDGSTRIWKNAVGIDLLI